MKLLRDWPDSGEGRAIKATTEAITRKLDGQQPVGDIETAFSDLQNSIRSLELLKDNEFFRNSLAHTTIISSAGVRSSIISKIVNIPLEVDNYTREYRASLPPPPTAAEIAQVELQNIVPSQREGPVKFEMAAGVLKVRHQAAVIEEQNRLNAELASGQLIEEAKSVINQLSHSNADPRLIELVKDMSNRIAIKQDVIQIGIAAISFQIVCDKFENELPFILSARLSALSIGVGMYVSQFSEWQRFSENAAMADFSFEDVGKLFTSGSELVESLRAVGTAVDKEVPRTLAFLLETIKDPRRATKRTVLATVRSIENLVIVVVNSCGSILGGILAGITEGAKKGTTIITATALLSIAGVTAVSIAPAAGRVLQSNWLGKAGKLIVDGLKQKQ
ncbi:hypothetical protein [Sphingomonas prati]|uniref:Uncharacterized protein n=1 Tax=Sphingomonas prati TaxID=1843237 RepID=A0A7W9BW13_9SPHN|nr:hypothetical protein [Sphingomonas prati]MBB5730914.1 hypothetical protein [Sphingomonas prati]GGE98303.1 hypothetical protein GCM10011404_34310 [Sphingomonas prati]